MKNFNRDQIQKLAGGESLAVEFGGESILLEPKDVQIERKVKEGLAAGNSGELTVALDTQLNENLLIEGLARELINKINTMRKEMGLEVTNRIRLILETTPRVKKCFEEYGNMISHEVLATDIQFCPCEGTLWDLNGEQTKISIQKV